MIGLPLTGVMATRVMQRVRRTVRSLLCSYQIRRGDFRNRA